MESGQESPEVGLANLPERPSADQSVDVKRMFSVGFPVEQQKQVLSEYEKRHATLRDWLRAQLTEGVHYGFPPGTMPKRKTINGVPHFEMWSRGGTQWVPETQWKHKPSLYKAGAERLVDLFQLKPLFRSDIDSWKMFGGRPGDIVRECRLISLATGEEMGYGTGASTRQKVDKDYDGKNMNAAVKMADKRALVAAVLNAFGLSDLFTQDTEDGGQPETEVQNPKPVGNAPKVEPRKGGSDPGPARKPGEASIDDVRELFVRWRGTLTEAEVEANSDKLVDMFRDWASEVTDKKFADARDPSQWDPGLVAAANQVLDMA